ncbi:MAG: lamin tail domain-containing protein [Bacteroidota bacterium]
MKPLVILFFSLLLCPGTGANAQQTTDDFADGNLLNPTWSGDTDKFLVTDGKLRLDDAARSGPAELSVATPLAAGTDTIVVEFLVEMDFAPSASNFAEVLVLGVGGQIELRCGGISGDQDALVAIFTGGGDVLGEITGTAGALGQSPANVRFRLRGVTGRWTLAADYTGGTDFVEQGTAVEGFDFLPESLLLRCNYTATRADKFSFDDLRVSGTGAPVDEMPPSLSAAEILDARNVRLRFSEAVAAEPLGRPENYALSAPGLTVAAAVVSGNTVDLELSGALPIGELVRISVMEARDEAGNVATDLEAEVRFELLSLPSRTNVLINEFLPDPNPVVGLPEVEFLELFNPTDTTVDLSGLGVASGGNPVIIGEGRLPAGGYVVLVPDEFTVAFQSLGAEVIPFNLPGLSNAADVITLSFAGEILQEISYTDNWYNDAERDNGGYSLEFTGGEDPTCRGRWRASLDADGGTPGRSNSVVGNPVDVAGPRIISIAVDPNGITLFYDEAITEAVPASIVLSGESTPPGISEITAVVPGREFRVELVTPLPEGRIFTLSVAGAFDCLGNAGEEQTFTVALPDDPEPGDVVINEILFNPVSGGSDFVEFYNCSDKVLQIEGWVLENTQSTSSTGAERTITASRLFLPGEFLTLTTDPEELTTIYPLVDLGLVVDQTLPSLPDDEGNLTVLADGVVLDAFDYTDDLHSDLLDDDDGVSLERLRFKAATQAGDNWFSAAASENFGTPTRANSQNREALAPAGEQLFSLANTTFSPDGDGNEDFLELRYQTPDPGYVARVRIFDAQGRPVRTLRRVDLLAGEGSILWDGATDDGERARAGIHVLFVELFAPGAESREEKLVAVLAGGR